MWDLKYTKTIEKSDSLKKNLLYSGCCDLLKFLDQNIPVLRENSISDIDCIKKITIEDCKLKEIRPGAFRNVQGLQTLNLGRNEIDEIRAGVFNDLSSLQVLDLSYNKIKNIEATAMDLPKIREINLANNLIANWNIRWFHNTTQLTRLTMANNSLEKIPTNAFVNRSYNFLSLNLSHNQIHQIEDGAFVGLRNIIFLSLNDNKLSEFGENVLEGVEVNLLKLQNNRLTCFTGDLSKIIKAKTTQIDSNPFDCECAAKVKKWTIKNNVTATFSDCPESAR